MSDATYGKQPPAGVEGSTAYSLNRDAGNFYRAFCNKAGYKEAVGDPRHFSSSFTLTKGTLHLSYLPIAPGRKINGVEINIKTAATATITPSENFLGLVDEDGNPLWSYEADALFALTGPQKTDIALGVPTAALKVPVKGNGVFVGLICNTSGTALIPFASTTSGSGDGPPGEAILAATGGTGLTAWPTTAVAIAAAAHNQFWAAIY